VLTLLSKGVPTKLIKFFWLKISLICHRCQRHRWSTLSWEYLREFSNIFEMVLMGYSEAGGKLIDEKNQKRKISWHCPFKLRTLYNIPHTNNVSTWFGHPLKWQVQIRVVTYTSLWYSLHDCIIIKIKKCGSVPSMDNFLKFCIHNQETEYFYVIPVYMNARCCTWNVSVPSVDYVLHCTQSTKGKYWPVESNLRIRIRWDLYHLGPVLKNAQKSCPSPITYL
jgi:hypothetical protein